jgi:hypothetical protein
MPSVLLYEEIVDDTRVVWVTDWSVKGRHLREVVVHHVGDESDAADATFEHRHARVGDIERLVDELRELDLPDDTATRVTAVLRSEVGSPVFHVR